jgi:hypothetical protein
VIVIIAEPIYFVGYPQGIQMYEKFIAQTPDTIVNNTTNKIRLIILGSWNLGLWKNLFIEIKMFFYCVNSSLVEPFIDSLFAHKFGATDMRYVYKKTISLEMPVPSQGHYGFHSFPVVD